MSWCVASLGARCFGCVEPETAIHSLIELFGAHAHRDGHGRNVASVGELCWLVPFAVALLFVLSALIENIWYRMGLLNAVLIPLSLFRIRLPWRELLTPTWRRMIWGVVAAIVFYTLGWIGFAVLKFLAPPLADQIKSIYAWADLLPPAIALPLLLFTVFGEELFWRGGVALPMAGRCGPLAGIVVSCAAYAIAHVSVQPPLLMFVALGAGAFWAWLAIRTRSLVVPLLCHALWDVVVLYGAQFR